MTSRPRPDLGAEIRASLAANRTGRAVSAARTRARAARRVSQVYAVAAVVLVPWIVFLAITLPQRSTAHHYRLTWVGFDLALLACLSRTAWLAHRRDPRIVFPAIATGALLFADAWFDVTTASGDEAFWVAVAFAVLIEIPSALFSLWLARRVLRNRTAAVVEQTAAVLGDCPPAEVVPTGRDVAVIDERVEQSPVPLTG